MATLGERNELLNRRMLVDASEGFAAKQMEHGYRTSTEQPAEQVMALLLPLSGGQLSLKELMEKVGLKHRPTFLGNYINPALDAGFIEMLYPDKPNHPKQKYLLSEKGLAACEGFKKSKRVVDGGISGTTNRKMANYGYLCTAQTGEPSPCVRSGRPEAFLKRKKETKKEILWVKKLC